MKALLLFHIVKFSKKQFSMHKKMQT